MSTTSFDIARYRGVVFDLDGVLWLGSSPIDGAAETVMRLMEHGHHVRFLTNHSGQARTFFVEKLRNFGVEAELSQIVTAGSATARYLQKAYGSLRVHVMGTAGLVAELEEAGHRIVETEAECVVAGLDHEFNWAKLDRAYQNLRADGCRFVACNFDHTYPDQSGFRPGTGANVAALAHCIRRPPDLIVGKPERHIMEMVVDSLGLPESECLMVGDKLESDILGGQQVGFDTLYVLSGAGRLEDIELEQIFPTYTLPGVASIEC